MPTTKMKARECVDCGVTIIVTRFRKPVEETRCRSCGIKKGHKEAEPRCQKKNSGQSTSSSGYVYVKKPDHNHSDGYGYVKRANLVWEESTGHYPDWENKREVLHHIDGDKLNDTIENLQLMTRSEHRKFHMRGVHNSGVNHPRYKHGRYIGMAAKRKGK